MSCLYLVDISELLVNVSVVSSVCSQSVDEEFVSTVFISGTSLTVVTRGCLLFTSIVSPFPVEVASAGSDVSTDSVIPASSVLTAVIPAVTAEISVATASVFLSSSVFKGVLSVISVDDRTAWDAGKVTSAPSELTVDTLV